MQTTKTDYLCTIREAQELLAVSRSKCFGLIRDGHLEAVRLGARCTRIKRSYIDRLIAGEVRQS